MNPLSHDERLALLTSNDASVMESLLQEADRCRRESIGNEVYPRGLIEFSNHCSCNCLYCGLRKDNRTLKRYRLTRDDIVSLAMAAYEQGFHSIVLQSGEIASDAQVDFLAELILTIKQIGQQDGQRLGITLSIGELSYAQYQRLWEAGAHRYLLRIETSDPTLFRTIHPPQQSYEKRLLCLDALKEIGYQVGTGVMIGLPGQNAKHLAKDLHFFQARDIDMLGMGPYIPHADTPLAQSSSAIMLDAYSATIKMMALARILMSDINMVNSTALQTIHPDGLKTGLKAGANVIMPILTPEEQRDSYFLYTNKIFKSIEQLRSEIQEAGYELALWKWGDSPHYFKRRAVNTSSQPWDNNICYPNQSNS